MNKENTMERNESNNWGDQMISEDGLRPRCPKCGAKCDDDGDRYFLDLCWECGWDTHRHRAGQNMNTVRSILSNTTQAIAIYSEALDDKDADWNSIANQIELSLQVIRMSLEEREENRKSYE